MDNYFFEEIFVKQFDVGIRFKRDTTFHIYHGAKLYGLVSRVIEKHPIGEELIIEPYLDGWKTYHVGESYKFGIKIFKNDDALINRLRSNLENIPESDYPGDLTNNTVELVSFCERQNINAAFNININSIYNFYFSTPLRHEKAFGEIRPGKKYYDPNYFDCDNFFRVLYRRLERLYMLNNYEKIDFTMPALPPSTVLEKDLYWTDINKKFALGGIIGKVKIKTELDEFWFRALCMGRVVHTGKNTSFGFGKFSVNRLVPKKRGKEVSN